MTTSPFKWTAQGVAWRFGSFVALGLSLVAGCQRGEELGPLASSADARRIREAFTSGSGEASSGAETVSTGTGWATLKGQFLFDGTPPQMEPYRVNRDQATCAAGGTAPLEETVLVDPETMGLANVAIYLRRANRVHESAQASDDTMIFDQKACVFLSHVFPLTLGQTVDIKNSDPVGHNTKISGKNGFNQIIPAGGSVQLKPQKEEAVPMPVDCSIHPWMRAYFLPRENGYYAVTGKDGSFEIANVPAGEELEFQVWHESARGRGGPLALGTPQAKELKWKKGRFKIRLDENEEKELRITVPASALGR